MDLHPGDGVFTRENNSYRVAKHISSYKITDLSVLTLISVFELTDAITIYLVTVLLCRFEVFKICVTVPLIFWNRFCIREATIITAFQITKSKINSFNRMNTISY